MRDPNLWQIQVPGKSPQNKIYQNTLFIFFYYTRITVLIYFNI
jgi:hypothetical protein